MAKKPSAWDDKVDVGRLTLGGDSVEKIALVDGSGNQIVSFGGGTQYTEGDVDATITGTAMLWEDTADTIRSVSAAKPLPVNIISGAGSGGTALADGAAFTPATTSITPVGGEFDDAAPASVTEGQAGAFRMSANRNLYATIRDAAGNERGLNIDANGALSVGSIIPGTAATSLGKAEDAAHTSGDTGVMLLGVRKDTATALAGTDGDYIPFIVDSSGRLHVNIGTAPAASRTTDSISAALATDKLMNNLTAVSPAFAIIDAATSGDNTLLAAQGASNKIRVHSAFLVASAAVTVRFESGAAGTALTGQMQLAANSGFVLPFNPAGWFETAANTLLNLELSGAISVDGCFQYTVVQ